MSECAMTYGEFAALVTGIVLGLIVIRTVFK